MIVMTVAIRLEGPRAGGRRFAVGVALGRSKSLELAELPGRNHVGRLERLLERRRGEGAGASELKFIEARLAKARAIALGRANVAAD